jgi:C1A family cysteine protease
MSDNVTKTGIVPIPNTSTEKQIGGHCIVMIGYDNTKELFQCINSWGKNWGQNGIFYLPYQYVDSKLNLAGDFVSLKF